MGSLSRRIRKRARGEAAQCYRDAYRYLMSLPPRAPAWLVHGTVVGTGGKVEDVRYGHAWVEVATSEGDVAIDVASGQNLAIALDRYIEIGKVEGRVRYTRDMARKAAVHSRHYGPWRRV